MAQEDTLHNAELASALLDIAPKILRQLRADMALADEDAEQHPGWREVRDLRATFGQLTLLGVLVEHDRCTMQELAEHMAVAPSTATAMVKRLYAQGYLERIRDEANWRIVWVRATEAGRVAVHLYRQVSLASLQCRVQRLSAEDRASILAALPALSHFVETER